MPNDKTPSIPLHETRPGGSWTTLPRPVDREPRAGALSDHRALTYVLPAVGCEVAERNLEVMIWSALCISVAKLPVR